VASCSPGRAYPQLRAAENFSQLQGALAQIEEAVQNARRYYNASCATSTRDRAGAVEHLRVAVQLHAP